MYHVYDFENSRHLKIKEIDMVLYILAYHHVRIRKGVQYITISESEAEVLFNEIYQSLL